MTDAAAMQIFKKKFAQRHYGRKRMERGRCGIGAPDDAAMHVVGFFRGSAVQRKSSHALHCFGRRADALRRLAKSRQFLWRRMVVWSETTASCSAKSAHKLQATERALTEQRYPASYEREGWRRGIGTVGTSFKAASRSAGCTSRARGHEHPLPERSFSMPLVPASAPT